MCREEVRWLDPYVTEVAEGLHSFLSASHVEFRGAARTCFQLLCSLNYFRMLCTSLFHNDTLETVVIVILCTASAVPAEKVTLEGTAAACVHGRPVGEAQCV